MSDPYTRIAECVAEGGWSSIVRLVELIPQDILEDHYDWAFEEDEVEDDEGNVNEW